MDPDSPRPAAPAASDGAAGTIRQALNTGLRPEARRA